MTVAFAALLVAASACSVVLGLDPPALDPCANAPCVDATADAPDAGPSDAGAEAPPPPPNGIRCGGNGFAQTACGAGTPICCQTTDDAGTTSYGCTAGDACVGYEIKCASNSDCAGMEICCHFNARITCATTGSCGTDPLICEPDGAADQCPGTKCNVVATIDGVPSAYWQCGP